MHVFVLIIDKNSTKPVADQLLQPLVFMYKLEAKQNRLCDIEALKERSERQGLLCRINGSIKPLTDLVFTQVLLHGHSTITQSEALFKINANIQTRLFEVYTKLNRQIIGISGILIGRKTRVNTKVELNYPTRVVAYMMRKGFVVVL